MTVADRRERERLARRDEILNAAQRVFYDKGYELAKMEDVAAAAQLGKGTLYIYFRTKEDLLAGVAMRHQTEIITAFEQEIARGCSGIETLRRMLMAYSERMASPLEHLKMAVARWARACPLHADSTSAGAMQKNIGHIFSLLCNAIRRGQNDGTIASEVPAPLMGMTLWSSVNGLLLFRLQERCVSMPEGLAGHAPSMEASMALLLRAVSTEHIERTKGAETSERHMMERAVGALTEGSTS